MTKDEAGLEQLKEIGVDKIANDTYIGDASIEWFLNKEFDKMPAVKTYGFIQILEKQYDIDLSYYRFEYDKAMRTQDSVDNSPMDTSLIIDTNRSTMPIIITFLAIALIAGAGYWFFNKPEIIDIDFNDLI